jgi:hypothetical protein
MEKEKESDSFDFLDVEEIFSNNLLKRHFRAWARFSYSISHF